MTRCPRSGRYLDPLEPRRLLSAALVDGTVVVLGSPISDEIRVYLDAGAGKDPTYAVEVGPLNGEGPTFFWEFPAKDVRSVLVRAGGGNDVIDLGVATFPVPADAFSDVRPVAVPSRIDAGVGDDTVYGGSSRDYVAGGYGKDRVEGGDGNDWINGGWSYDVLRGGAGNDFVFGGAGNDVLGGEGGNDRLYGGPGNDFLGSLGFGPRPTEPGDDLLFGGSGEDRLVGGDGKDRLFGGTGRDHFSRADDESEMPDRTPDEPVDIVLPV